MKSSPMNVTEMYSVKPFDTTIKSENMPTSGHMTEDQSISGNVLLDQLNSEEIQRLTPLVVYLMLISLVGIPGNSIVYHVYRTQYKRSNSRYFILCLSAIDLFTCMFVIPFELFTVLNQYTYTAVVACKLARFCNSTPTVASGFMFLLIAIDRHRKVCKPLGWQIRPRVAKCLCAGTVITGVLFSWPVFLLYGKKTFTVESLNLTATECSTADSVSETIYPFIYNSMVGLLFVAGTTSLVTLYAIIGKAIKKHAKDIGHFQSTVELKAFRNESCDDDIDFSNTMDDSERSSKPGERSLERNGGNRATLSSSVDDGSVVFVDDGVIQDGTESTQTTLDRTTLTRKLPERTVSFDTSTLERSRIYKKSPYRSVSHEANRKMRQKEGTSNGSGMLRKLSSIGSLLKLGNSSESESKPKIKSSRSVTQKRRMQRSRKLSFIMFLITLAYIGSYLPHVTLMMARAVNHGFVESMTNGERAVYKFFLRSYFLNCVVNPFIYSACDTRFRNAIKQLLRCPK